MDIDKNVFEVIGHVMSVPPSSVNLQSSPATIEKWDSLRHMRLILALEDTFSIIFSEEDLIELTSVAAIVERIHKIVNGGTR